MTPCTKPKQAKRLLREGPGDPVLPMTPRRSFRPRPAPLRVIGVIGSLAQCQVSHQHGRRPCHRSKHATSISNRTAPALRPTTRHLQVRQIGKSCCLLGIAVHAAQQENRTTQTTFRSRVRILLTLRSRSTAKRWAPRTRGTNINPFGRRNR